jgi:hypothetical protein
LIIFGPRKSAFKTFVVIDSTGVGDTIVERLEAEHVSVYDYQFTYLSKKSVIERLAISLDNGRLRLLDDPIQEAELRAYEFQETLSGKTTTNAPSSQHTDHVIALALSNFSFSGGAYFSAA